MKKIIRDLHLLLIYLTGWEDRGTGEYAGTMIYKSWKGYLYDALDELEALKLINHSNSTKIILLTDQGKKEARLLQRKYFQF